MDQKDQFLFKVFINDSTDDLTIDEHRFKISITYAALPSNRLHEFIQLQNVIVSRGGSVAINESHVNLDFIRNHFHDDLLVDFSRKPQYGQLDILKSINNQTTLMKLFDLSTGRSLIYRHQKMETLSSDEILFHILPKNEANRRANRLRIIVPVTVISQKIRSQSHIRTLIIDIPPSSLSVENHSDIEYVQGKTYILLNRTHFGIKSNGDRSKIVYKIMIPPENGTLYWVAGEKEANTFTQNDIDEERVLYAQLNMQAFQDRFEFKVVNELNETWQGISYIRILPIINPRTLIVNASSITLITDAHLNASILQGLTPRFFVTKSPRFGRFILGTNVGQLVEYFTYNDVVNNSLFYISNQTNIMMLDFAELELNADEIQPARFRFNIEIHPSTTINYIPSTDSTVNHSVLPDLSRPSMVPINGLRQKEIRIVNAQKRRKLDTKTKADLEKQPDLLSTTVYATIGRSRRELSEKQSDHLLQTFDGSKHHASLISTSTSQQTHFRPLSGELMDCRALNARNTPELNRSRPDRYHSTRLKDNQYWV
ncbi:Chondroitin sulfate proteoglycan 4 [Dirofilaria immitis]|nr:Chondroitin sulfate proteoglycan 4 [Dirofilaria immitis]